MSTQTSSLRGPAGDTDDIVGRSRSHAVTPVSSTFRRLVATESDLAPAVARLGLGLVMLPHALQKAFGWFGGAGLEGTYDFLVLSGVPAVLAVLAMIAEIAGTLGLILGAFTRVAALGIGAVMVGAIAYVHAPNGFFMNWMGAKAGEGFELHLLALTLVLVCILAGGGRASVDRVLMDRRRMEGGSVGPL